MTDDLTTAYGDPVVRTEAAPWDTEQKDHDYGDVAAGGDGMTHLLMAYRQMIDHPACEPLLGPLMEIIHGLQGMLTDEVGPTMAVEPPEVDVGAALECPGGHHEENGVCVPDAGGVYPGIFGQPASQLDMGAARFDKDIKYEDGQYCVFSTTGRRFGCYGSEDQAKERLAQIEQFSNERVTNATTGDLATWHDRLHAMADVTPVHVVVHNLIEDALEARGVAAPYVLGDATTKLAMITEMSGVDWPTEGVLPLAKRAEQRYTLGPVYVPGVEDAHGEFTDEDTLQKALWEWVRRDNRSIYLQHSEKVAGEMVEVLTWPFEVTTDLTVPGEGVTKYTFPADTPFMGVIWEDWAWELVKAGALRGYSIGGRARRMEADLPVPALID